MHLHTTCSSQQLLAFEKLVPEIKLLGIDEVYCVSVNDSFVMNAWGKQLGVENVKLIPIIWKLYKISRYVNQQESFKFGNRSWRYMAVKNGVIEQWWQEPGINNEGLDDDPYVATTPNNVIDYLRNKRTIDKLNSFMLY